MSDVARNDGRVALWLGALLFALFALLSSGTTGSGDAMIRYSVAKSLVATGDVAIDAPNSQTLVGRGGRLYTIYGVGQSLLFAIPEAVVQLARAAVGGDPHSGVWEDVSVALASVVLLPLVSAIGFVFLYLLLVDLGLGRRAAVATTLVVAFASPLLPYAKFHQEENQIVAISFAIAYFAVRFGRRGELRDGVVAGLLCWIPMWFRPTAIAESLPLACLLLAYVWDARGARERIATFGTLFVSGATTAAWLLFFNWYRFGSVTETGYGALYRENGFDHGSWSQGLLGPFFNPSKSILHYSPLLVVAALGARAAWRERHGRRLLLAALATLALSVAIPASFKMWGGDTSWGPRYEIAGHALLLVFVGYAVAAWRELAPAARRTSVAAMALGVVVQLLAVGLSYNLEYHRGLLRTWDYTSIAEWYDLSKAQIPLRLDSLARFGGNFFRPPAEPRDAIEEYSIPAFLPWKLGQRFGPGVWGATLALWLAAWVAWALALRRLLAYAHGIHEDERDRASGSFL
jgi:hypothetical protein